MCLRNRSPIQCIIPPYVLEGMLESGDPSVRAAALDTLLATEHLRGERTVRALTAVSASPDTGRRTVYDCGNLQNLASAALAHTEDGPDSPDRSVNDAFRGLGLTRDFYGTVLGRDSIDDRGMRLNAFVHYGSRFQNAFWDGQEMIFGDGDGTRFGNFTGAIDVIAHELTHGVTEYTANLEYHNEPGALNESISDVFGSLVKQWARKQSAAKADWLIGAEIFTPHVPGDALRSMKAPGTAFKGDPQPDHMSKFVRLPDTKPGDWGGVHYNSGIPNRAFYLTATAVGGNAWEAPGHIWYESLRASAATTGFQEFADTTFLKAGQMYGTGGREQEAVRDAWQQVGIHVRAKTGFEARKRRRGAERGSEAESFDELQRQIRRLADRLEALLDADGRL